MSNSSDEGELVGSLQKAAEFMRAVRKGQTERGKGMTGGIFLGAEQIASIEASVAESNIARQVDEIPGMDGAVFRTAQIFEEMCRRQHVSVSDSMRAPVVRLLAGELMANQEALPEATMARLEILTALQGAIGPDLVREFGERFSDSRSYFGDAARHAANPREYLERIATKQARKYDKKSPYWTAEVKRSQQNSEDSRLSSDPKRHNVSFLR